jgi:hypothetical protein
VRPAPWRGSSWATKRPPGEGAVNNCEQPTQRPTRPERREPQHRW